MKACYPGCKACCNSAGSTGHPAFKCVNTKSEFIAKGIKRGIPQLIK